MINKTKMSLQDAKITDDFCTKNIWIQWRPDRASMVDLGSVGVIWVEAFTDELWTFVSKGLSLMIINAVLTYLNIYKD